MSRLDRTQMPPLPPGHRSRFFEGAQWRRALVYAATAVAIIYASVMAVRLAQPPPMDDAIRVENASGHQGASNVDPGKVFSDPATGESFIEMNVGDGVVKRYRVEPHEDGWRVHNEGGAEP